MLLEGPPVKKAIRTAETAYKDTDTGQVILELSESAQIPREPGGEQIEANYMTFSGTTAIAVFDELEDRNDSLKEYPEPSEAEILGAML